jgi:hypothetical protein
MCQSLSLKSTIVSLFYSYPARVADFNDQREESRKDVNMNRKRRLSLGLAVCCMTHGSQAAEYRTLRIDPDAASSVAKL